jgi:hypothetical protein
MPNTGVAAHSTVPMIKLDAAILMVASLPNLIDVYPARNVATSAAMYKLDVKACKLWLN